MGTTTESGPWTTQVGVGVGEIAGIEVLVNVRVTIIVSKGGADTVGEGSEKTVAVDLGAASTVPPHAVNNNPPKINNKINFFIEPILNFSVTIMNWIVISMSKNYLQDIIY
jgi:hypothetical protein